MNSEFSTPLLSQDFNNSDESHNSGYQSSRRISNTSLSTSVEQQFIDYQMSPEIISTIKWMKIEILISVVCLCLLFPIYLYCRTNDKYPAKMKNSYLLYIAYIAVIRLPSLIQIQHFLVTYHHESQGICKILAIIDILY
jgi:hypothetical protein